MKIEKISATNLKGSTFADKLGALTLIYGPNFAGKTTRIEALALALTHSIPGHCVRPGDIFDNYASGARLEVFAKGSGATGENIAAGYWSRGRKNVEATFEGYLEVPPLLFNISEFLDLSAKERTRFLFRSLPPAAMEAVTATALITKLKTIKGEEHSEAHELAINDFTTIILDSSHAAKLAQTPPQEWLEDLVDTIAELTKQAKAAAKTMRATALGNIALRSEAPTLGQAESDLTAARQVHAKASIRVATLSEKLGQARREYLAAKELSKGMVDEAATRARIDELSQTSDLAPAPVRAKPVPGVMITRPTLGDLGARYRAAFDAMQLAEVAQKNAEGDITRLNEAIHATRLQTCCPTCGHDITDQQKKIIAGLKKELKAAELKIREACSQHILKKEAEEALQHELEAAVQKQNAWDQTDEQVREENQKALDKWNAEVTAFNAATAAINERRAELNQLAEKLAKNAPAKEAWAQLPSLENAGKEAVVALELAQIEMNNAEKAVAGAEGLHRLALADAANEFAAQKAGIEALKLEAKAEVGTQLREMFNALLQECVKQSIAPLLTLCNGLCSGILPGPLLFVDGEIVMQSRLTPHSHKTFSGTEKALAYAALAVGLAINSPIKLVILDELGRLDRKNKLKLIMVLDNLITRKVIDQAILVDTEAPDLKNCTPVNQLHLIAVN